MYHHIHFTESKIANRIALIEPLVYIKKQTLAPFRYFRLGSPLEVPPVAPEFDDSGWEIIEPGSEWGEWKTDFILRTDFQVPMEWIDGNEIRNHPIGLYLPIGDAGDFCHPEALVYIDGLPYAACDRFHHEILLPPEFKDGRTHSLALHGWTGLGGSISAPRLERLHMRKCHLVMVDQALRQFIRTARVGLDVAQKLDANHPSKDHLLNVLDNAFITLGTREPLGNAFYLSVPIASQVLQDELTKAGEPLPVELFACGHAHIDVAWLWTLGQTRRKAGRTFYNVIRLMERYPSFFFAQSQPQLYEFVRQDYPELFRLIQERVKAGQWEVIGGMWVEADCNLSGFESLARQFLLGRTFYREHFGAEAESPVLWLPDVFGYAWNMPQLIRQAGMKYFFTIKIGWSQYNRLPYDTFWWQGLDGTRVLTHFSTSPDPGVYSSTYNAMATPQEALGAWENFQQKELRQPLLMAFGHGDGGGGPTAEMVENLEIMSEFPAIPRLRLGRVGEFFSAVESAVGEKLPVWNGELYLELHRGTYTSQGRNKMANRRSEFLLHDAEFLATYASIVDQQFEYPSEELHTGWELVCLNQFHDIIPGSSIAEVYAESLAQYAEVQHICEVVSQEALATIARQIGVDCLIVNPTSFIRQDLLQTNHQNSLENNPSAQSLKRGTIYSCSELPPYSIQAFAPRSDNPFIQTSPVTAGQVGNENYRLENDLLLVEFSSTGDLVRLFDKEARREVLPPETCANIFQAFEDRPNSWDAWDIDIHYQDRMWLSDPAEAMCWIENGPLRVTLEISRKIFSSTIIQRISLAYNSRRLDFDTYIDWHEHHVLLKVAFPVRVLSPSATYEIQWGNVQRPTHRNTSWDWARFETAAQKWVDLSEGGYGVSLLNNGKYGHDIHENVIRLTLLRSPTNPDASADLGEHRFIYSLFPHPGNWDGRTIAEAYALNDPIIFWTSEKTLEKALVPNLTSLNSASFVTVDVLNLVIETIKRAEDGQGIILRWYESQRMRGRAKFSFPFPVKAAWQTNLLEENQNECEVEANQVTVYYRPFEICTLRIQFQLSE